MLKKVSVMPHSRYPEEYRIGSALFPHILDETIDEYLEQFDSWFKKADS